MTDDDDPDVDWADDGPELDPEPVWDVADIIETGGADTTGEITTSARVNGRRLTLDAVLPLVALDAQPRRVENSMPAGFRVGWMSGETEDYAFEITAGAGVGSRYLILHITQGGQPFAEEIIDVEDLARRWIDNVITQGPTPTKEN